MKKIFILVLSFRRNHRPVEMKKNLGGLPIMKYSRPPWLTDEELIFKIFEGLKFRFEVLNVFNYKS